MIIDIIIASYNGEKYIAEQIASILEQTYENIRLLIRDDGSTDNTVSIIKEFAKKDSRVVFIEDDLGSLHVGENFKNLLSHCSSEYVFLSDQDDFWNKDKVEVLLNFSIENFQKTTPCIAYSAGSVVNENLVDQHIWTINKPKIVNSHDIFLINGGIQGCSMIINRALYMLALENKIQWYM
ncbi:glycosyltransferase, partial [Providencia heimbachae]|uniref:glycosyltransferase n=2 Tax=Providencia heimbachae TaxID=333962 RepID=UPI0022400E60